MKLLTKLLLFFVPLTLFLVGAAVIISGKGIHSILVDEVNNRGLAQISGNTKAFSMAFESGTEAALLPLLQSLKEQLHGVQAAALDQTGRVLAHTNVMEKGKTYSDALTTGMLRSESPVFRETAIQGEVVLEISAPVWSEEKEDFLITAGDKSQKQRFGTIMLGMPLTRTIQLESRLFVRQSVFLILAAGGLSLGLIFFMMWMILLPARRLAAGISKVSEGQYGLTVPVGSNDELGQLTAAFNLMAGNLGKTTVSRDKLAEEIIERKRIEEALRETEEKYRLQFEGALDAIVVADAETGLMVNVNNATAKLVGREKSELIGQHQRILYPPQGIGRGESADTFEYHLTEKKDQALEAQVITKTGELKEVSITVSQLEIRGGKFLQGIFRDVTMQRKLEASLMQSDKLSAIGQLAAGVAHEINNPLGIILGFAQSVIKRLKEGDSLALPLKTIEREAIRCKDLVQNLLVFSRTPKGAQLEELDTNAVIEGALSLISAQTKTHNVELVKELYAAFLRICANKTQLQQVIINLANNALDAMPKGGTLTISTVVSAKQPGHVEIRVRDTGTGIAKDLQKKIFEPFFTTKEVGKGTGLGLSLVYEIVQKHGGTIELVSEEGKGAVFTVLLPLKPAAGKC
ncbi:MAG: hypothetical protein A2X34_02085 [Elusimicrobia bacterium GWC2_51_8]|nr:MAG: hypothetical protein A2X33_07145 [Elusimicrobia bacterium GWA2_51_34]OGR60045.1 MAG: hypothetical protein A2X34_02085 [Elusimicrobia bacterium GWC2_51_8]HAF95324.1 hypothetical protein [Elusimicrobiota bacterium]HCE96904.1 hypothetical protein [Elusimicrobiota bacterium]